MASLNKGNHGGGNKWQQQSSLWEESRRCGEAQQDRKLLWLLSTAQLYKAFFIRRLMRNGLSSHQASALIPCPFSTIHPPALALGSVSVPSLSSDNASKPTWKPDQGPQPASKTTCKGRWNYADLIQTAMTLRIKLNFNQRYDHIAFKNLPATCIYIS